MSEIAITGFRVSIQQKQWLSAAASPWTIFSERVEINREVQVAEIIDVVNELSRGHEIFRTIYTQQPGFSFPIQQVQDHSSIHVAVIDIADTAEEIFQKAYEQAKDGACLSIWVQISEGTTTLHCFFLALSFDQRSAGLFIENIAAGLLAEVKHADEPVQYIDVSEWQYETVENPEDQEGLAFWEQQSLTEDSLLEGLVADQQNSEANSVEQILCDSLATSLMTFSKKDDITLEVLVLSAFQLLINNHTAYTNPTIIKVVTGRSLDEIKDVYGRLEKQVPFALAFSGEDAVSDVLRKVDRAHRATEQWQAYFQETDALQIPFLFQFLEQKTRFSEGNLNITSATDSPLLTAADLQFTCSLLNGQDIRLTVGSKTGRYGEKACQVLLERLVNLLTGMIKDISQPVKSLDVLGKLEKELMLHEFNQPYEPLDLDRLLAHMQIQQRANEGTHGQISSETESIGYTELNARANRVANYLLENGLEKGEIVGILTQRSIENVVAMLGVLKAGGAYLPLAPDLPKSRFEYIVDHSSVKRILYQEATASNPFLQQPDTAAINVESAVINTISDKVPEVQISGTDLAYIIYTSGSTGQPKGCQLSHANLAYYVEGIKDRFLNDPEIGDFPFFTNFSFDFTITSIFGALCRGKNLHIYNESEDIESILKRVLEEGRADVVKMTPSHMEMLDHLGIASNHIKMVISGGEKLGTKHLEIVKRLLPNARIINHYGPTETTVGSVAAEVGEVPYIGKPLKNIHAYLLDNEGAFVPVGQVGELCIAGKTVSVGYLDDPDITGQKFKSFSFETTPCYHTGDLARISLDGNITCLGRIDHQVKIRGHRVETAEIEHAIMTLEGIDQAVVMASEEAGGSVKLLAFYQSAVSCFQQADIKNRLSDNLPEYMIPDQLLAVEQFPLTANGKLDRDALLALGSKEEEAVEAEFFTPTEEVLVNIWRKVLNAPSIGLTDDFFMAGGHSILATQLISRMREAFDIQMPLKVLFANTTIKKIAEYIEEEKGTLRKHFPQIERVQDRKRGVMSHAQQRLWSIQQKDPANAAYNIYAAIRLSGPLLKEALKNSLEDLVERHESFRTTFAEQDGEFYQILSDQNRYGFQEINLTGETEGEKHQKVQEIICREANHSFDLTDGPLLKVTLIHTAKDQHVLVFSMHHIIIDEWSVGVFIEEFSQNYQSFATGNKPVRQPLDYQMIDYATWHNALIEEEQERLLDYWRAHVGDAPLYIQLPFAKPSQKEGLGQRIDFSFSQALSAHVHAFCLEHHSSLHMVLLAAFKTLIHQYTHASDLVIGTPVANRNHQPTESILGFLVNVMLVRTQIREDMSFKELLAHVRSSSLEGYEYQDLPYDLLIGDLVKTRGTSAIQKPLNILFNVHTQHKTKLDFGGLEVENLPIKGETAKNDLLMSLEAVDGQLQGYVEFSTSSIEAQDVDRLILHYQNLLDEVTENPDLSVKSVAITSEEEKRTLQVFNDNRSDYPQTGIPELFSQIAEQFPDKTALSFGDESLTYQELDQQSDAWAKYLQDQGLEKGDHAAVVMNRSMESVLLTLAIVKCGAAYVPVDIAYPPGRMAYMLSNAGVKLAVVNAEVADVANETDSRIFVFEEVQSHFDQRAVPTSVTVGPDDKAYIMYTSGSTGQSKGVVIRHRGIVRLLFNTNYMQCGPERTWSHLSNTAFDASTFEIWGALLFGSELVVLDREHALKAGHLKQAINTRGIDTMFVATALFNALVSQDPTLFGTLKDLLVGGEAQNPETFKKVFNHGAPLRIINCYGPTESTTFASCHQVTYEEVTRGNIPIGVPVKNTQVLILNKKLQNVVPGAVGELFIGGDGLAQGYLNNTELTATKFIDLSVGNATAIYYQTGDLVRLNTEGFIEYIGRVDDQLKISGYRVEPDEIKHQLLVHDSVDGAAVLAVDDDVIGKKLVAFYTTIQGEASSEHITAFLEKQLPHYMVPAHCFHLEQIPLSSIGKVDRAALLSVFEAKSVTETTLDLPQTDTEIKLADMWKDLLSLPVVHRADQFFHIGAHSLHVTQMTSRVAATFQASLTIRDCFENPVLHELAALIDERRNEPVEDEDLILPLSREQFKI